MKQPLIACLLATALGLSVAGPAAAEPPTEVSDSETFLDVNPCSGLVHEVTIAVTFVVHQHDDVTVARGIRTLTTSSGYVGAGTSAYVQNGDVELYRFNDRLSDDSGNHIMARGGFVLDLASDTLRVDSFTLTCLGS